MANAPKQCGFTAAVGPLCASFFESHPDSGIKPDQVLESLRRFIPAIFAGIAASENIPAPRPRHSTQRLVDQLLEETAGELSISHALVDAELREAIVSLCNFTLSKLVGQCYFNPEVDSVCRAAAAMLLRTEQWGGCDD